MEPLPQGALAPMARVKIRECPLHRSLVHALYDSPETVMPKLCGLLGLGVGLSTRSSKWGLGVGLLGLSLWNQASKYLTVSDLRLGPLINRCPSNNQKGEPQVWLTFDDGPAEDTCEILETLEEWNASATFFMIGKRLQSWPEKARLRELLERGGHTVGNHTWSHPNLLRAGPPQLQREFDRTERLLKESFPKSYRPIFRPPYGYRNLRVLEAAKRRSLTAIGWSRNSLDFLDLDFEEIAHRIISSLQAGEIILLHDGPRARLQTLAALPLLLQGMTDLGFSCYRPTLGLGTLE